MTRPTPTRKPRGVSHAREAWLLPDDGIVDPIAVDVAAAGARPVRLTAAERELAAARILAAGGTAKDVGVRLRMPGRAAAQLCARLTAAGDEEAA